MISKISRIGSTHNNNQDFQIVYEIGNSIKGIICDGCSTGRDSEFGSRLLSYIIYKGVSHNNWMSDSEIELVFRKFKNYLEALNLSDIHGFTTAIFFEYFKENKCLECRFFGDGFIKINEEEIQEIDHENIPDYFIYYQDYGEYLKKYPVCAFGDVDSFSIGTDGIFSFSQNQFKEINDINDPKIFITSLIGSRNILERRSNILKLNGWSHSDDLTIVSYANTE